MKHQVLGVPAWMPATLQTVAAELKGNQLGQLCSQKRGHPSGQAGDRHPESSDPSLPESLRLVSEAPASASHPGGTPRQEGVCWPSEVLLHTGSSNFHLPPAPPNCMTLLPIRSAGCGLRSSQGGNSRTLTLDLITAQGPSQTPLKKFNPMGPRTLIQSLGGPPHSPPSLAPVCPAGQIGEMGRRG
jgi:hypothetical protein